ncbi:MAG TPA: hypothetical protein VGZ22_12720 [Isosphaeraceae bacterium]|jgi:tetratricopeptide (TPR) repeat protein|nr:hypothetical protein [Isosphaeraceae bacterium]
MDPSPRDDEVLALVHEGWKHLKRQCPLAAWACWQRALRIEPEDRAASQALAILEQADDLPAAARASYRFRLPANPERRNRWNTRLEGHDILNLDVASDAFRDLTTADPADASAWYNLALCLAWNGANGPAINALEHFVALQAREPDDGAAAAWALAEVLRAGSFSDELVDDLSHSVSIPWGPDDPDPTTLGIVRAIPSPVDHELAVTPFSAVRAFEWLDRPMPELSERLTLTDLPRVLATVILTPQMLRVSSPDPQALSEAHTRLSEALNDLDRPCPRQSVPLPLSLLDAAVWTIRLPAGLDDDTRRGLARMAVEHYYENVWIHLPRRGLAGRSPLAASRQAAQGDAAARARLAGVILVREQLGARQRTAELYGGYPFDRLRRRLGHEPESNDTVDPADCSCMSEAELDHLDPAALDDVRLAEACESAAGLGDDARTARFASVLAGRSPTALDKSRVDAPRLLGALVRQSLSRNQPEEALTWLDRAKAIDAEANGGRLAPIYDTWRAEVYARKGEPDAALRVYEELLSQSSGDPRVALDAAATMFDRGYVEHTRPLAEQAVQLARSSGNKAILDRAQAILAHTE